jgi:hypothetical protein
LTRGTLLQIGFGVAVALGLVTAAFWRAPRPSSAASTDDRAPPAAASPALAPGPPAPAEPTAVPPGVAPAAPRASAPLDEPALMSELRHAASSDRPRAMRLAQEGNRRFPDSPDAPERTSILIHALAEEGQSSAARGAAEEMVNHYPDSAWVREVEAYTGAHRHRNLRVNDEGGIETY